MANRRFGGPQRGNNRGYNNSGLSPWQGGVGPGGPANNIQAQIALALTNLLQPKPQTGNPPSLLSLNPSQGFFNDSYGGPSRYDRRRPEPYKQNRGNWRDNKQGGNKNFQRGPQRYNRPQQDRKYDNRKEETVKKEEKREDHDEKEQEKRDFKSEKQNTSTSNENNTESSPTGKNEGKKDRSKYSTLPPSFLHCFICNKSMWDGESFQNHIGGTAHSQMMNSVAESFRIVVGILRENMRLAENKEMIELNRMARSNRKFAHKMKEPQSVCNMCDMKFLGKITVHRKTAGHQRLKRFLHPKCDTCNLEFPSRIEWVEHRFTPEHLFKLKEVLDARTDGPDGYIIDKEYVDIDMEPLLQESLQSECENPILEMDECLDNVPNRIPAYKKDRKVATSTVKPAQGFICEICHRFFENEENAKEHLKTMVHYHSFVTAIKKKAKRAATDKAEEETSPKKIKIEQQEGEDEEKNEEEEVKEEEEAMDEDSHLYDPEEDCDEEQDQESKILEDQDEDMDDLYKEYKTVNEKEEEEEEKHSESASEPEEVPEVKPTPTPRRPQTGTRGRRGILRNK